MVIPECTCLSACDESAAAEGKKQFCLNDGKSIDISIAADAESASIFEDKFVSIKNVLSV